MIGSRAFFTIFTSAYNRAYRLSRLFESLRDQSLADFEWIVIDDGSTDHTGKLINHFKTQADFPIIYIKIENGGKHKAVNLGIKLAKGEWFFVVDSDDWLESNALEVAKNSLDQIGNNKIVSMIITLAKFPDGKIIGDRFPSDLKNYEEMMCCAISGDKPLILYTLFLKNFSYKEFPGEKFIAEGGLFFEYTNKYKNTITLFINQPLYVAEYLPDGLTKNSLKIRRDSVNGCLYTYSQLWKNLKCRKLRYRYAINYYRFLFHGKQRKVRLNSEAITDEIPTLFAVFGYMLYIKDRIKLLAWGDGIMFYRIGVHAQKFRDYFCYSKLLFFKKIAKCFINRSFMIQSQMDVNPLSFWHNAKFISAYGGFFILNDKTKRVISRFDSWDQVRRDMLILLLKNVIINHVEGDLAELGVYKGMTAKLIHYYLPDRKLYLFDTFEGFDERDLSIESEVVGERVSSKQFCDVSVSSVKKYIRPLRDEEVIFCKGYFPETTGDVKENKFAFVHIDADFYSPIKNGLEFFYPRLAQGGMMLVHDYNCMIGAKKAVDEFCSAHNLFPIPMPDKSGSALIVKNLL